MKCGMPEDEVLLLQGSENSSLPMNVWIENNVINERWIWMYSVLSLNVFLWRRELGFIVSFWKCWIEMHEIMAMCLSKFNSCLMKSTVYFWWQVRVACFLISCSSVMKKLSGKRLVKYLIAFFCVGYAFSISNRKRQGSVFFSTLWWVSNCQAVKIPQVELWIGSKSSYVLLRHTLLFGLQLCRDLLALGSTYFSGNIDAAWDVVMW